MRSLSADIDGPVHYLELPGDGPTIVCVHELGGSHANWLAVAPGLARRARVLALDLAGFGRTPPAGRGSSLRANRRLLDRFLDEVAGGPAILMGNSMGGALSILEARRAPDKVAGLVLVDPALPRPPRTPIDGAVAAAFALYAVPAVGEMMVRRRARRLGPEGLVRETLALCCADPARVPEEVVAAHVGLARERLAEMPWSHRAFLEAARSLVGFLSRRARYHSIVREVSAPTLLVHGARDRLVPLAAARAAARLRPDWTFEVFENAGHVPQLEMPAAFVAAVESWLDGPGRAVTFMAGARPAHR